MTFVKRKLSEIDKHLIIELLNDPEIRRHMPLSTETADDAAYSNFINAKQHIWDTHGFGPWAYLVNDDFIGWAGIQPDENDFEIAIVLFPKYWGLGKKILKELIEYAFYDLKLESIIILFPESRVKIKGLLKIGFVMDGQKNIDNVNFIRYRLYENNYKKQ